MKDAYLAFNGICVSVIIILLFVIFGKNDILVDAIVGCGIGIFVGLVNMAIGEWVCRKK